MVRVAPSILSADFAHLERDCRRVLVDETPMLHFDVMDGVFVPNISFGLPVLKSLHEALPQAEYDVHLMIVEPHRYVERFAQAGANYITIHYEATPDPAAVAAQIRRAGARAGLSLKPGTPVEALYPVLYAFDMVLVMSVEPGFGGQAFMRQAPDRIRALRREANRQGLNLLLEVDGGIDRGTAPLCIAAGVNILVAGSAVFGADNPAAEIEALRGAGER